MASEFGGKRILHVITDLGQGGAEAVLFRLIQVTQRDFQHEVISLHQEGVFAEPLRSRGVNATALGMQRGRVSLRGLRQLKHVMTRFKPDVMQTRLEHANLLGGLLSRFAGAPPVVWAVHSTELGSLRKTWKTRVVRGICARLSYVVPSSIVCDARSSASLYERCGFSAKKLIVVPNGIDPESFRPDTEARERIRRQWAVGREEVLLGCVARWDPLKDHATLLGALEQLMARGRAFRCVLVGRDMDSQNGELQRLIAHCGVAERVILAGPTSDVAAVMNALDVHVLSSRAESLPVAVLEAMACGTPCVVTDVGDARHMVGETGWVARPRDPSNLAQAIEPAMDERGAERAERAALCRKRVIDEFSLAKMGAAYADLWQRAAVCVE